jgi:hypothetical protein
MDQLYILLINIEKDCESFDKFQKHVLSCSKQFQCGAVDVYLPESIRSYNDTMINKIKSELKEVIKKNQNINNDSLKIINEDDLLNIAIIINKDKFLFNNNDDKISHINPNLNIKIKNLIEIVKNILGEDKTLQLEEEKLFANNIDDKKNKKYIDDKKNKNLLEIIKNIFRRR